MTVTQDPPAREGRADPRAPLRPHLDSLSCVNPDGSRRAIHPADVHGRYQRRKAVLWGILIAVYLVLPWLRISGRPVILIDIARRHFHWFGHSYNAQDFHLAFFLLTGVGFTLIVVSALFGRIWCGYACPQTVFLEGVFRRIERWFEGNPRQRQALALAPWTLGKIARRGAKLAVFLAVALVLSHTLLAYFVPVDVVLQSVRGTPTAHPIAFAFTIAFTVILFLDFAWFREQLCIVLCPYGRLQGVLYDRDTINVTYDQARGEPRGHPDAPRGDCVDCLRCIAVCPTGIDIRNGTQLECIGCANCIDACDEVMARLDRRPGLIRYDSQNGVEGKARRWLRPRVQLYGAFLLLGLVTFTWMVARRSPFEANLVRSPGMPYLLAGDTLQNQFLLHLYNKLPERVVLQVTAQGPAGAECVVALPRVELEALTDTNLPIFVRLPRTALVPGDGLTVTVELAGDPPLSRTARAPILGPTAAGGSARR